MTDPLFEYPDASPGGSESESLFLADWTEDEWANLLRSGQSRTFRRGEIVIRAGEAERVLSIVAEGKLEVRIQGRLGRWMVLQTCGAGSVIGEQAFVDGRPRSATIQAATDGRLMRLSLEGFETFSAHYPALGKRLLFDLARILSLRLRRANALLGRERG